MHGKMKEAAVMAVMLLAMLAGSFVHTASLAA